MVARGSPTLSISKLPCQSLQRLDNLVYWNQAKAVGSSPMFLDLLFLWNRLFIERWNQGGMSPLHW